MRNPGAVAWYCPLKLEMIVSLTKALLTEQMRSDEVPGREDEEAKLVQELQSRVGVGMQLAASAGKCAMDTRPLKQRQGFLS